MKKKYHTVTFLPEGTTIRVEDRLTIFETIMESNPHAVQLHFACGAEGICQKCKIRAFHKMGPLTPIEKGCLSEQEVRKGIRLSCQARVVQDMKAEILYKMPFTIELVNEALSAHGPVGARVCKIHLQAAPAESLSPETFLALMRQRGSFSHAALPDGAALLKKFPHFFQRTVADCTAVIIDGALICLEDGNTVDRAFAVAVDLGTNTLVVSLVDLVAARKIAVATDTNPQIHLGTDLETRINMVALDPLNLEILNEELMLRIDVLILELCRARSVAPLHVYEVIMSGTTGMLHLFLKGVPGVLEQQPRFSGTDDRQCHAPVYLKSSRRARIRALPVISSYVGADITAGIFATQLHCSSDTALLIDLGTEVTAVCHHQGRICATSVAEGAAFEGAGIACGMRPEAGAIDHVAIDADVHLGVIGESLPRGLCGSGFIELAAALKRTGILDPRGNLCDPGAVACRHPAVLERMMIIDEQAGFEVYRGDGDFEHTIFVTQNDIYRLREAKAWTVTLLKHLTANLGIDLHAVSRVLIGGAFGQRFDAAALFELGLLPNDISNRVFFVGNTSKKGAQMALLDRTILEEAERLVKQVSSITPPQEPLPHSSLHFLPYR